MTLPPPILGADPLRSPAGGDGSAPGGQPSPDDPLLGRYGPRPEAGPAGEAAGVPLDPEAVTAILVGLFDTIAAVRGPHWHAEPQEFALAAPPLSRELNKPDTALAAWLARHGDAFLIILGLGAVTVPRVWLEYQVFRYRKQLAEEGADTDGRSDAEPRQLYPDGPPAAWDADAWRPAEGAAPPAPGGGAGSGAGGPGDAGAAPTAPTDPAVLASSISGILGH